MLIAPEWITGVHRSDETVSVSLSREAVKIATAHDPDMAWSREPGAGSPEPGAGRRAWACIGTTAGTGYWAGSPVLET